MADEPRTVEPFRFIGAQQGSPLFTDFSPRPVAEDVPPSEQPPSVPELADDEPDPDELAAIEASGLPEAAAEPVEPELIDTLMDEDIAAEQAPPPESEVPKVPPA
jgi:hypothetical protein